MPNDRHLIEIIVEAHDRASKALNQVADAMDRLRDKAADVDKDMQRINKIHDDAAKASKANVEAINKETAAVEKATTAKKAQTKAQQEYGKSIAPNIKRSQAEIERISRGYTTEEVSAAFQRERRLRQQEIRLREAEGNQELAQRLRRQSRETVLLNGLRRLERDAIKKENDARDKIHQQAIDEYNARELRANADRDKLHEQAIREYNVREDRARAQRSRQHAAAMADDIAWEKRRSVATEREYVASNNRLMAFEAQFRRMRRQSLNADNLRDVEDFRKRVRALATSPTASREAVRGAQELERTIIRAQRYSGSFAHALSSLSSESSRTGRSIAGLTRQVTSLSSFMRDGIQNLIRFSRALTPNFLGRWIAMIGVATVAIGIFGTAVFEASFALTAGLAAAIAQTLPIVGLLGLAFLRVSAVFKVMQLQTKSNTAEQRAHQKQLKATSDAAWQLHQAQLALADAQKQVVDARREALRNIQDLNDAEEQAITNAERAKLAFSDSARALAVSIQSGNFKDIASQQLDVSDAQRNVGRSAIESARAQQDAARARKEGVAGNQQVVQALRAVADAEHQIAQLRKGQQTAATDPAASLNLQDAKKQLDKTEQGLLGAMTRLRDKWKTVGKQITDPIIASFTDVVDALTKLLDDKKVVGAAKRLSGAIGTAITDLAKFLTSPKQKSWLIDTMDAAAKNLPAVEGIVKRIITLFEHMATIGKPVLKDLLGGFKDLLDQAKTWLDAPADKGPQFGDDRSTRRAKGPTNAQQLVADGRKQLDALASLMGSLLSLIQAVAGIFAEGDASKGNTINGLANQIKRFANYINANHDTIETAIHHVEDYIRRIFNLTKRIYGIGQTAGSHLPFFDGLASQIAGVALGFASVGVALKLARNPLRTFAGALGAITGIAGTISRGIKNFRGRGGGVSPDDIAKEAEQVGKTGILKRAASRLSGTFNIVSDALAPNVHVTNTVASPVPVIVVGGGGGGLPGLGDVFKKGRGAKGIEAELEKDLLKQSKLRFFSGGIGTFAATLAGTAAPYLIIAALNKFFGSDPKQGKPLGTPGGGGAGALGLLQRNALQSGGGGQFTVNQNLQRAALQSNIGARTKTGEIAYQYVFPKKFTGSDGTVWVQTGNFNYKTGEGTVAYTAQAKLIKYDKSGKPEPDKQLSPREATTAAHHREEGPTPHPVARPVRGEVHDDVKPPDDKPTQVALDKIKKHHQTFAQFLETQKTKTAKLITAPFTTGFDDANTVTDKKIKSIKTKLVGADFASPLQTAVLKLDPVWQGSYNKASKVFNRIITGVQNVAAAFSTTGKVGNFFDQLKLDQLNLGQTRAATGGMFGHVAGGRQITVGEGGHDEVVLSTDPRYARRSGNLLGQYLGKMNGKFAQGGWVGKAQAAAELIDRKHFPYSWGGGHADPPHPNSGHASSKGGPIVFGYDCSGAVSAVLSAAGLLKGAMVASGFESYGAPGPGKISIYANDDHTFMSIGGRGFGTGGDNPHGGAGWLPYNARPGFVVRHATGKQFLGGRGGGDDPEAIAAFLGLGKVPTGGVPGLVDYTKAFGPDPSRIRGQGAFQIVNERLWAMGMRLAKKASAGGGGGGGGGDFTGVTGPKAAQQWIRSAMAIVTASGQRVAGDLWFRMLMRQAKNESGFDPNVTNTTDINAQRGDPSIGLLQTTGSTFRANALPGHGNIRNPIDNAIAAIRYIIAAYGKGNPTAAAQAMWDRGGGAYAAGGELPGRLGKAMRITAHAGEMIINRAQQAALGGTNYLRSKFGFGSTRSSAEDGTYIEDRYRQFVGRGVGAGPDIRDALVAAATKQIKKAAHDGLVTIQGSIEVLTSTFISAKQFSRVANQMFSQFENFRFTAKKGTLDKFNAYFENIFGTGGILENMATRLQHAQTLAAAALTRRQFRVAGRDVVARGNVDAANVAAQTQIDLARDRENISGRRRLVDRGIQKLRDRLTEGGLTAKQRQQITADLNSLLTTRDSLITEMANNISSAAQATQERVQGMIDRIQKRVTDVQQVRDSRTARQAALGQTDTFQDPTKLEASLRQANVKLEAQRKAAAKRGDTASVATIKKQIDDNRTQAAQLVTDTINHTMQQAQDAADKGAAEQSIVQRKAQALGQTLGDDFYQTNADNASKQMDLLNKALDEATKAGDRPDVVAGIKAKIADLNASMDENTAQMIQAHIDATDKAFADQITANQQQSGLASMGLSSAFGADGRLQITGGTLGRGPNFQAQSAALLGRQNILGSRGSALEAELAWVRSTQPENAGAIKDLTEKINQNTIDQAENSQAILDNTHAVIDDMVSRAQSQQEAQTGPLGGVLAYLQKIAAADGATAANTEAQIGILGETNKALEQGTQKDIGALQQLFGSVGLGDLVSGLSGLSGSDLVNAVKQLVSGDTFTKIWGTLDDAQKATFNTLINTMLGNESTIYDNTQAIKALDGTITGVQSFSSTAWQRFRNAFFTGMGQVLPQYSVPHMDTGGWITKSGMFHLEAGEAVRPAWGDSMGSGSQNINLNIHQVKERFDPEEVAATLAFKLKTKR